MERVRDLQKAQAAFETPRRQMQISPVTATERLGKEVDELYVGLHPEPNLWEWGEIASEVADVFLYLVVVANRYGIDIGGAVTNKLAYNQQRFPVALFDGSNGKSFADNYAEAKRREGKPVPEAIDVYNPSITTETLMRESD